MDKIPRCVLNRERLTSASRSALLNKDIRLCMEEAEAMGMPMVVGSAVRQILAIDREAEGADADMTELIKVMEDWAGVSGRVKIISDKGESSGKRDV